MYGMLRFPLFLTLLLNAIGAGTLLGVGFVFPAIWPAVFVGSAFFIYGVRRCFDRRGAFLYGWVTGTVLWMWASYSVTWLSIPLDWFGITNTFGEIIGVTTIWVIGSAVCGVGTGIGALLIYTQSNDPRWDILIIPSSWVLSEWVASIAFCIVSYGPGSIFGAHFTLGWIGYQLGNDIALLQSAWLGGVYALSFIASCIGVLLYKVVTSNTRVRILCIIALFLIFLCVVAGHFIVRSFPLTNDDEELIKVGVMSRYEPPHFVMSKAEEDDTWDRVYQLIKPLRSLDVLVFPEDTAFLRALADLRRVDTLATLHEVGVGKTMPLVIDSEDIQMRGEQTHSSVSYLTDSSRTIGYKQFLLPIGEHIPYVISAIMRMVGLGSVVDRVEEARGYGPGPSGGSGDVRGSTIVVRFCDESMSPELYRSQVQAGADLLVDISSLSWFHGSRMVYEQMKLIAQVRAVESARWFVQSGNMSPAFILDDHGRLVGETTWGEASVLIHDVSSKNRATPYIYLGSLVLLAPLSLLCVRVFIRRKKRREVK